MNRLQKFLALLLVLELGAFGFAWHLRSRTHRLPPVDWHNCLVDPTVAEELRAMERHLDFSNPASWADLARKYRTFGLYPQSEFCYQELDRLHPSDLSYLYYWADCLDQMGKTREATRIYQQIVDQKITVPLGTNTESYCWLNMGQDRLREENVPAAIEALGKSHVPKAKFLMSRVLIRSDRAQEAVVLLDELLRDYPNMVEYLQMMSWAKAALGDQDSAQDYYDLEMRSQTELDKMDPTHQEVMKLRKSMGSAAWVVKARELETQGKYDEALEWNGKAMRAFWNEDRADQQARILYESGRSQEALDVAEKTIHRTGAAPTTLDIIGLCSAKLGDLDRARQAWEQAAELSLAPFFWSKLVTITADMEQMKKYQGMEQYAIGKEAWIHNNLPAAQEHLERSAKLLPDYAHTWFYLGDTRRARGDASGAEAAYRRCLEINPHYGRAMRGLERLNRSAK